MKKFILGYTPVECKPLMIQWDTETGITEVMLPDGGTAKVFQLVGMKEGVVDVGVVVYSGPAFSVLDHQQRWLQREFPSADLDELYVKATEWAVRKQRKIKNVQTFLYNWLKKEHNKGRHKSGVML